MYQLEKFKPECVNTITKEFFRSLVGYILIMPELYFVHSFSQLTLPQI